MSRSFRAPAKCWMLAAAALCAAVGSGRAGALAQEPLERDARAERAGVGESLTGTTSPEDGRDARTTRRDADQPPHPADFCLAVKNFDFNERPLGNYEDTPMYWQRMTGEGLPAFSDGRFDDRAGHRAPPSFLFTLRGGSIGYEYDRPDLAIVPHADYLVEGCVRAEGLHDAVALVACYMVDQSGQRLAGSEQVSRAIRSAAVSKSGAAEEWQRVEIPVHVDFPDAVAMRFQLWVLQNYVIQELDENAIDPIARQEVDARVWFDDLALVRLPRACLSFATPGGLIQPGATGALELALHNPAPVGLRARLTIVDEVVRERFRTEIELPPGATEELTVDLPALPPGTYDAYLDLVAGDFGAPSGGPALVRRTICFVALPELSVGSAPRPDKGVDLGRWPGKDPQGAEALAAGLGGGTVKLGFPMSSGPKDTRGADYLRDARDLVQALGLRQMDVVGVVLPPAIGEGIQDQRPLHRMIVAADGWAEQLGPLLLCFGGHVAWWQLGDETTELREAVDWNAVVGLARRRLKRFLIAPQLVVPQSILDASPAAELLAPQAEGAALPAPVTATLSPENTADVSSFWVPTAVPARALPWHLAFLFDRSAESAAGTPGVVPRLAGQSSAPWLSLELDHDPGLPQAERLADLARRFVLASAANPARLYVPAPFELTVAGGIAAWQPTDEYIPLRTLIRHLSGLRAVAAIALPDDAVAVLFGEGERHTLVLWTWQQDAGTATADLYVGGNASAWELSGARRSLEFDGPKARVPLTAAPVIITDVDAALLLLQDSFQIRPTFIQLHDLESSPVLSLRNPYPVEMSGTVELHAPSGWDVSPNPVRVQLAPGQTLTQALDFSIPPRQVSGARPLEIELRLTRPEPVTLHFTVLLEVGLRDIVVEASAWWDGDDLLIQQSLCNQSPVPVSFNAFCQPPEQALLEGAFLDVPAGQVRTHSYRLPAARALAGTRLWMGIAEIGGRRSLDQLVSIPR